jgi:hypothetical protein
VAVALLAGAADELEAARTRLQGMSPKQRDALLEALRRFDLQLSSEQQKSVRELDQQIAKLPFEDRVHYLAVLRRYHNWLDTLPETVKDDFLGRPPEERMTHLKSLTSKYPIPQEKTPYWMQFAEVAGGSPFELAAVFKIWHDLAPDQRREIEKLATVAQRRDKLLEFGRSMRVFREVIPVDFRVEEWIPKVEAKIDELRGSDPELRTAIARAENKLAAKNKGEGKIRVHPPILRRLAINLYLLSQDPPRSVSQARLDEFFAALPPWVHSSFDSYPADEARRRLTLVYRLVFPYPSEFQPARGSAKSPGASTKTKTGSPPPQLPPTPVPVSRREPPIPANPAASTSNPF